jgi:hypothetical protein
MSQYAEGGGGAVQFCVDGRLKATSDLRYDEAAKVLYVAGVAISPGVKLAWVAAPAAANDPGVAGQVAYDATHFYVCTATNSWVRVVLAAW